MKIQKLASTVIIGALALSLSAPAALAVPTSNKLTSEGTIRFHEDNSITPPMDPEKAGEIVSVDESEGTKQITEGPLAVDFVSTFKFENGKISTAQQTYNVKPTMVNTNVERGNYIQVTDKRSGSAPLGWNLTAQMTKQFTYGESSLKGTTIIMTNPFVNSTQEAKNFPTANSIVLLEQDNGAQAIAKAEVTKGWGTYTIEYGKNGGSAISEAVQLIVPANTQVDTEVDYKAEVTWTIVSL